MSELDLLWIVVLGAQHGLQPDHAAAAAGLATRTRTSAWRAALRLSTGHVLALGLVALLLTQVPESLTKRWEPLAATLAGSALLVLGVVLLLDVWRARYVVHRHRHEHGAKTHEHLHTHPVQETGAHEHRHASGALVLGLVLGLGGARSLAVLLPAMVGPGRGVAGLVAYGVGIALGALCVSALLDVARAIAERRHGGARWADLIAGGGSVLAGAHLLANL